MSWIESVRNKFTGQLERPVEQNPIDKVIVERGSHPEVNKVYEARWVWYHTILAVEIFFTNILLIGILVVLVAK
jgi:hypothetical protein